MRMELPTVDPHRERSGSCFIELVEDWFREVTRPRLTLQGSAASVRQFPSRRCGGDPGDASAITCGIPSA